MKQILSERKINKAVSESINEFLIQEGWWDNFKQNVKDGWNAYKDVKKGGVLNALSERGGWALQYYFAAAIKYGEEFMREVSNVVDNSNIPQENQPYFNIQAFKNLCVECYNFYLGKKQGNLQQLLGSLKAYAENCGKWDRFLMKNQNPEEPNVQAEFEKVVQNMNTIADCERGINILQRKNKILKQKNNRSKKHKSHSLNESEASTYVEISSAIYTKINKLYDLFVKNLEAAIDMVEKKFGSETSKNNTDLQSTYEKFASAMNNKYGQSNQQSQQQTTNVNNGSEATQ